MKLKVLGLTLMMAMCLGACAPTINNTTTMPSTEDNTTTTLPGTDTDTATSDTESTSKPEEPEYKPKYINPDEVEGDYINIHYHRKDGKYDDWWLWLWEVDGQGNDYAFNGKDDYGGFAKYPLSWFSGKVVGKGMGFIVKKAAKEWLGKDVDGDRFVDFGKIERHEDGGYHIYLESGDANIYVNPQKEILNNIDVCEFKNTSTLVFKTSNPIDTYVLKEDGKEIIKGTHTTEKDTNLKVALPESFKVDYNKKYTLDVKFLLKPETLTAPVSFSKLFKTDDFNSQYYYEGNDLGAVYTANATTFKVWSPISEKILLRIYESGTPVSVSEEKGSDAVYKEVEMVKGEKGVFATKVDGDLQGKYYTYVVTNSKYDSREIVDPYAKACGVNGLRGMICDFSRTNPKDWNLVKPYDYDRKQLTVYETHIADLTSSPTWNGTPENAKLFKGFYETGTKVKDTDITTGFDHIKELGVNAVQLIPIFDQANDELNMTFNWGYNPLNYNCLEGGYSTDPYDGYVRIREFKELVQAYNKAGINIIMDVVYNHVNGAIGSNFDVLMPDYFFRLRDDGGLSNGSGCGNETASELLMYRKFMIDSTEFLASEYKLGGFRFDLMGLHDLDTMEQVSANLKKVNSSITVYGEPWMGGTSPLKGYKAATQINGNKYVGYGQFNDQMRDALIAGGMKGDNELGWINKTNAVNRTETPKIRNGLKGFTGDNSTNIKDPDKTVNYVTCHDNYTLYDRFKAAGETDEALIKKMALLANSMVFTSQGTTFMLAGEEFLRTKNGSKNSYNLPYEDNELNYDLKVKHLDMFELYKKLIKFKINTDGMHLDIAGCEALKINFSKSGNLYDYEIKDTANNLTYHIFHRNGCMPEEIYEFDLTGYNIYLSTIDSNKKISQKTNIEPYETLIVSK